MTLDADTCYRALGARDPRFDGVFFVGVTTTGIYCRPICPARTPRRDRIRWFSRAAEAEHEGFRACFRCRPEIAPGLAPVDASARLAAAAADRIATLGDASLDRVAEDLGITPRHLRRVVAAELGVSPVELAQSARLALAKQLLHDTSLSLAEIAFSSGFSSVRRFNASFLERFGRPPGALRGEAKSKGAPGDVIRLRLDARPPFDWTRLLAFLGGRAIDGVESVEGGTYRRTIEIEGHRGAIRASAEPARAGVLLEVTTTLLPVLRIVVARARRLFDLDAEPGVVAETLRRSPHFRPLVAARPGLRLPGAFDGFELAVRAVLGQQISVKAARTLASRLVGRLGVDVATPFAGVHKTFPSPRAMLEAGAQELQGIGVTASRARYLTGLARAVEDGAVSLEPRPADPEKVVADLVRLDGFGDWTAHYVAMRALSWPDAFPTSDLVLRRRLGGGSLSKTRAEAELIRPYRAYGAIHLWSAAAEETAP